MTENTQTPIVLVDGSSYLYRAFHAMSQADLRTSAGVPTGAVRGVISMLRRLIKDYTDSVIVVIFDAKGKTFRDDIYPDYKSNRPPMPDDLRLQIEPIHNIIKAMGLPLIIVDGVEADDVIGTYARQATELGQDVVVSTGDKDMAQLVNKHITLVNTMTDTVMDEAGVIEKFGITPAQIIDYLALVGDKVDNIPGVPKCGPKTAVKWLTEYGSLEGVMANADAVKGKIGESLRSSLDMLPLSQTLATIKLDVELPEPINHIEMQAPNSERLLTYFHEMEFKSWVEEIEKGGNGMPARGATAVNIAAAEVEKNYQLVLTEAEFEQWLAKLQQSELFAFDTETTSLNYMEARVVGVSFAVEAGDAAYVPFGHDYLGVEQQLGQDWVLSKLKPLLEDPGQAKVGQNLKYDKSVLANHDIELNGIAFDTMLESYVLDSTATRHNMDSLAKKYLDVTTVKFEEIAGKGAKQLTFNQIALSEAALYAAEDADITLRLHQALWPRLQAEPSLASVLHDIELPLVPVLSRVERNGALVSRDLLSVQSAEIGSRLLELEKQAYALAGEEFNLSSPKQLGHILFEKLEIPAIKKTPKGAPSTAEEVLAELALDYPLPKILMEYRGLSKLKSTYTDKLPEVINPATGRIHTSYHQAVTATGRLSSSDPNLQNIPVRTAEGRRIRQAFIAPKGYQIVAADYSQIELRIMAHLSQDKGLLEAFAQGKDIHRATAAEVFGVSLEQVDSEQRRRAKAINFGLIYGMSAFGLAKQINVGRNEAQVYIDTYFARYPGVKRYMDQTRADAAEQGYVETLFGRRLHLPEINASNGMRRQAAERTAINAPMQGTAADIIKKAMVTVDSWLSRSKVDAKMIMQVHDELVFEVAAEDVEALKIEITALMSAAAELDVPLIVDVGVGDNWDEAH
ncbi:MAG: DNA polymerase I [Spongiibacteraceae bacterium]